MGEAGATRRDPAGEVRASDLQVQFEQVGLALQQLRQTSASLHEMEARLAEMTGECAAILDRWAKNDERHAAAVVELHSRLSEWNDIERRLLSESTSRIHQFERSLQHEWHALRQKHEEPIQQLDVQTARITETCLTAVDHALQGFARAEARLAGVEQDLHRQMGDLAREVREALEEVRRGKGQLGPRQPWSLDNVVRLHNELRGEPAQAGAPPLAPAASGSGALGLAPAVAPGRVPAMLPQPPAVAGSGDIEPPGTGESGPMHRGAWQRAAAAGLLLLAIAAAYGVYLHRQLQSGLRAASTRAEAAERDAARTRTDSQQQLAAVQQTAEQQVTAAQQAASSAQGLARILAAPDLVRFALGDPSGRGRSAQVLWSRSQGVAFSASRLPPPPPDRVYQLWLLTPTTATSAGLLAPDAAGRASVTFDPPAALPRPIVRASVTLEPAGGAAQPSEPRVLSSAPPGPPPAPGQ